MHYEVFHADITPHKHLAFSGEEREASAAGVEGSGNRKSPIVAVTHQTSAIALAAPIYCKLLESMKKKQKLPLNKLNISCF